ncbi:MAG: class I SAM-dependent methyltransferase, partial [Defluviitaleaceae bacterium]|nr:class I SAM-dependent methyltransferase [Defluviitaleaceae bacterium]
VLELGCGTGRVALALAAEGIDVTGLDLSNEMLDIFRAKLEKTQTPGRITLVHASMADYSLEKKYSLIIAPFRAFQLVTQENEIDATLERARDHLADGGLFILNAFRPYAFLDENWKRGETFDFEATDEATGARVVRMECRERIDVERQIIYPYLAYDATYPDGGTERVIERLSMKYYYAEQLRERVEKAGFSVAEEYSWYDKTPPGPDGREIIFVCKKREEPI